MIADVREHVESGLYSPFIIKKYFLIPSQLKSFVTEDFKTFKWDMVVFEKAIVTKENIFEKIASLTRMNRPIYEFNYFYERVSKKVAIEHLDSYWLIEGFYRHTSFSYHIVKSLFDKIVSIIMIVMILPFYLILLIFLFLFHRPVFYTQERVGLLGKRFNLFKLRTMVVDAEKDRIQWSQKGDSRITKIGNLLRKSRLDELPQLINILKGEMSLVGPRPERQKFVDELLKEIRFYDERHLVKPGATGWAQVNYPYGSSIKDSKEKLKFDLYYIKHYSLALDVFIFLKTIKTVLGFKGR